MRRLPDQYLDRLSAFAGTQLVRALADQEADRAIGQEPPLGQEVKPVAQLGIRAVSRDDEIGLELCSVAEDERPFRGRCRGLRVRDDFSAGAPRRRGERVDHLLAQDREHAARITPAMHGENAVVLVARLTRMGKRRVAHSVRIGAERLEHP